LIRVCLSCGHSFDVGFLSDEEAERGEAVCPICRASAEIVEARRLVHPPDSKRRWVLGEAVYKRGA